MNEIQKIAVSNSHPLDLEMKKLNELIKSLDAGVSINSEDRPANENEFGILKTSAVNEGTFIPHEYPTIGRGNRLPR